MKWNKSGGRKRGIIKSASAIDLMNNVGDVALNNIKMTIETNKGCFTQL